MGARFKDKQWRSFYLSEFFSSEKGNQNNMASLTDGNIPLVSARKINNGYKDFVSPNGKKLFDGNIITLNNDGDGGAGIAYYQPSPFALDTHVTALTPRISMSYHVLLFVAGCITKQRSRFGHGHPITDPRLKKFIIMLPVCDTDTSKPDWAFMEAYMRQVEQDILKPTIEQLKARITDAPKPIGGGNWKAFNFIDIFNIKNGFYNKKPPCYENGIYPFIGATDSNNGVTGFTSYESIKDNSKIGYGKNEPIEKKIYPKNAICVTNNGSVGYAYFQSHNFTCTHDVNPLYLKDRQLNRHLASFLIGCIEKQRVCFEYARKWRPKRMVKSRLMLPVTTNGTPDWQYMEDYMRYVEQKTLKQAIQALSTRITSIPCA